MNERRWPGGFYHVTVDNASHQARHVKGLCRPFHCFPFQVDEFTTPQALYDGLRARLTNASAKQPDPAPVVEIRLEGVLPFNRNDLDLEYVRRVVNERLAPLITRIKNNTRSTEFDIAPAASLNRAELELAVLRDLIRRDARHRERADQWAAMAIEVKRMVLDGSASESIAAAVRQRLAELSQE